MTIFISTSVRTSNLANVHKITQIKPCIAMRSVHDICFYLKVSTKGAFISVVFVTFTTNRVKLILIAALPSSTSSVNSMSNVKTNQQHKVVTSFKAKCLLLAASLPVRCQSVMERDARACLLILVYGNLACALFIYPESVLAVGL
jgi:hypothetical protein